MIKYKRGNIIAEDTEAIVNAVNCVGIMGRGLALQFKKSFPENFKAYTTACDRKEVQLGRMFVSDTLKTSRPYYIINFPTKQHWRHKSRIEDIDSGLKALVQEIKDRGIRSIAIPAIGCGLGGLEWAHVQPLIVESLKDIHDLHVIIFEPQDIS